MKPLAVILPLAVLLWLGAPPSPAQAALSGADAAKLQVGVVAVKNERYPEAERIFTELLEKHPRSRELLNNLGILYLRTDRLREAFAVLETLRVINPEDPLVHFNLAQVFYRAKLQQRERDALITAIRLRPTYVKAHRQLARALQATGALYAASAEYAWLIEHSEKRTGTPDPESLVSLSVLYERLGQPEDAVRVLNRYLEVETDAGKADVARMRLEKLTRDQKGDS